MSEAEVDSASPPELKDLPPDFWNDAVVVPPPKRAISLRVDQDVLDWFRSRGPRYQSRMNAVLACVHVANAGHLKQLPYASGPHSVLSNRMESDGRTDGHEGNGV